MNELYKLRNIITKRINRIFKKLFRVDSYKEAVELKNYLGNKFEFEYNKKISDIVISDLNSSDYYDFVRYRTLKKIIDLYGDVISLSFYNNEMEEYKNEC